MAEVGRRPRFDPQLLEEPVFFRHASTTMRQIAPLVQSDPKN